MCCTFKIQYFEKTIFVTYPKYKDIILKNTHMIELAGQRKIDEYIYIYMYICIYVYIHIYIYM